MPNTNSIDLCGLEDQYYQAYADYFSLYLPNRAAWKCMPLDEKLSIEARLRHCQEMVSVFMV